MKGTAGGRKGQLSTTIGLALFSSSANASRIPSVSFTREAFQPLRQLEKAEEADPRPL